jgi:hypothetical protein
MVSDKDIHDAFTALSRQSVSVDKHPPPISGSDARSGYNQFAAQASWKYYWSFVLHAESFTVDGLLCVLYDNTTVSAMQAFKQRWHNMVGDNDGDDDDEFAWCKKLLKDGEADIEQAHFKVKVHLTLASLFGVFWIANVLYTTVWM